MISKSAPLASTTNEVWSAEVDSGQRFEFGRNWQHYSTLLDERRNEAARRSLKHYLGEDGLRGRSFLDIGSGSGLFSLAAWQLGANVDSIDFDERSVACTESLRQRLAGQAQNWTVRQASVLDPAMLPDGKTWDVVYSWGVLHHTGQMWDACANAAERVAPGGRLFIALYNDQGSRSGWWLRAKQMYNSLPKSLRWLVVWPCAAVLWGPTFVRDTVMRGNPFATWKAYGEGSARGMNPWFDLVDWVGGLPFEVATPDAVVDFHRKRGFALTHLRTCAGGHGCNEFVFERRG